MSIVDQQSSSLDNKPQIVPVPYGPLQLINSKMPEKVENLRNSKDQPISKIVSVVLRRYGASNNKLDEQ